MTKNTKEFILIISVLIVVFGSVYTVFFDKNTVVEPKKEELGIVDKPITAQKEPWQEDLEAIKELQKTHPTEAENKLSQLLQQLPKKLQRYYALGFQSGIEDIRFYGQLIDQHDKPVAGAVVSVDVGGRYLAAGSGQGRVVTGQDGRFSVRGEGGSLSIGPIKHPNLDIYRKFAPDGDIEEGGAYFTSYQHTENGNTLLWTNHSDPSTPYIFKVWRKTSDNTAKKLYQVSNTLISFDCSGGEYTLNLIKSRKIKRKVKGIGEGQLRVRYSCKDSDEHRYFDDWAVEIEAIEGGIQETQDLYLNVAPKEGYEPFYRLSMTKGESNYQKIVEKRFYFTANNNQYYGSLEIRFDPYGGYDGEPLIFLGYKMNPTGEPYLVSAKSP
ncbi:hypothetical protein ACVBE9_03845 [Eionea flava]